MCAAGIAISKTPKNDNPPTHQYQIPDHSIVNIGYNIMYFAYRACMRLFRFNKINWPTISIFSGPTMMRLCFTGLSGGNFVDGLPPASNILEWVFQKNRPFTTFWDFRRAVAKICKIFALTSLCSIVCLN